MYNGSAIAGATSKTLSASKPGEYRAVLTLKSNAATICEAVINLAGAPCKIYELDLSCQVPNNITLPNAVATGVQLAVGGEFTAGDYTVVVTEIVSGSPVGWKGKGYVKMKLVAGIVLKQISVNFENVVVNECYELASGSVVTDYDPNWGSIFDIDALVETINDIRDLTQTIFTWSENFTGIPEDCEFLKENLPNLKAYHSEIGNSKTFSESEITLIKNSLSEAIQGFESILNDNCSCNTNQNLRIQEQSNTCAVNIQKAKNGLNDAIGLLGGSAAGKAKYNSLTEFFESAAGKAFTAEWFAIFKRCSDSDFRPYEGGTVPECFWRTSGGPMYIGGDLAFSSGFIDGAYITLKTTVEFPSKLIDFENAWIIGFTCHFLNDEWKDVAKIESELKK